MEKILLLFVAMVISISMSVAVNFVSNGTFESDLEGWSQIENEGTHSFVSDANVPLGGTKSGLITILTSTTNGLIGDNYKQGLRWRMSAIKNATYKVRFKAKASKEIQLISIFQQNFAPYAGFGENEWTITTAAENYEMVVTNEMGVGGDWSFVFYYGHLAAGDKLWIDDISIEEIPNEITNKLSDGNICNGDFEVDIANSGTDLIAGGWRTFNADPAKTTFIIDSATPISGKKSFKGTATKEGTAGWHAQIIWNFCPVVGQLYTLEFKAKASENVGIVVESIDDWPVRDNAMCYLTYDLTPSVQSFKTDIEIAVTEYDTYTLIFWLGNLKAGKSIWLDDIKLYQTNTLSEVQLTFEDDPNTYVRTKENAISIGTTTPALVNIYNLQGKNIISQNVKSGENTIPCEKGIYIVQVIADNRIIKSLKVLL